MTGLAPLLESGDLVAPLDQNEAELVARELAAEGVDLAIVARGQEALEETAAELRRESERRVIDAVLDYLEPLGARLVMYSGLRYESDGQLASDLAMLNRSAERCAERGVRLLYHNHNWEFADGARVMRAVLEDGCPALGLCPDVGWVMKGGRDAVEFLEGAGERVGALHFKDFATAGGEVDTVLLGTGVAPLREAGRWAMRAMDGGWMIAEQDRAEGDPAEAVAANGAFLRGVFGGG